MISTYKDALDYVYTFMYRARKLAPKYTLDSDELSLMRSLMARLDNPQLAYPVILIAGTKGKGSTATMCESILRAAGYKTGLTTSPRLHTFRERIRIGGEMISEAEVIRLANELQPHFEAVGDLITFERMTAMAFLAFAQANIDIAVVEVGIGGRLDSTNVSEPTVSVITSISYDHTFLLGNTLSKIATEKAGIIRNNGLVISAPQYPEAMSVIEQTCAEKQAHLTIAGDPVPWRVGRTSLEGQILHLGEQTYWLPLMGEHQAANATTALAAIEALQTRTNLYISYKAMHTGLANVRMPGRLEVLSQAPFVMVDCAMNHDSVHKLRLTLAKSFPGREIILIFGASQDHDYTAMLTELLPDVRHTIVTQSTSFKSATVEDLLLVAQPFDTEITASTTIAEALATALALAQERDMILVTGSLFLVADARIAWAEHAGLPLPEMDPE